MEGAVVMEAVVVTEAAVTEVPVTEAVESAQALPTRFTRGRLQEAISEAGE
jgi:hypothetical protein